MPKLPALPHWPTLTARLPAGSALPLCEALLAGALALQAARLAWLVVVPPAPLGALPVPPTMRAPETTARLAIDAFHPRMAVAATAAADTSGLRLHALRAGPGGGAAIIAGRDGRQRPFAVGDEVAAGVILASVAVDHVLLASGGTSRRLAFEPASAPTRSARAPAAPALPTAAAADRAPAVDPAALLAQAGLRPKTEGGRVTGYTVIPRGDGAVLRQAGLAPGDVLLAVNGQALTPERQATLAADLAGTKQLSLTFRRGEQTRTTTLQVPTP